MAEERQLGEVYSGFLQSVLVDIEAGGSMRWFLNLKEEL